MQLFLSHATPTKPRVRAIVDGLPSHVACWLDAEELTTGHRFGRHIERAIAEECDFLVAFVDAPALASDWVRREVALGLRREADLHRTFVLPVVLDPAVLPRLGELDLADRLHLHGWHDDPKRVCDELARELFALASRLIEGLRDLGRRGILDAFGDELTAWKQAAFQWRASLGNGIDVLTTNQAAFDHVRDSVAAYNAVSDAFIPRLGTHRDRIVNAWQGFRGLCEDTRDLVARIEAVYRGEMYRLNEIHELVHQALVAPPDAAGRARAEARRLEILAVAGAALDEIARSTTRLVTALEREID